MELSQLLVALARDGAAFGETVTDHLEADVPSCPGWSIADLVYHLGEVDHFWADIVEHARTTPEAVVTPERVPDGQLVSWYRRQLAHLERTLATADPEATVWTWSNQHNTAFVVRRMAQETAVHLWDARHAIGAPMPIEPHLAEDGVDEFITHFAPFRRKQAPPTAGRVEFVCNDSGRSWRTEGLGDPDAVVSGTAADLLLVLWRRAELAELTVDGDVAVAERFIAGTGLD